MSARTGKGPHPATYKLSDEWTHDPILWASDEPADHGHSGARPWLAPRDGEEVAQVGKW